MLARRRFPRLRPNAVEICVSILIELRLRDDRVYILDGEGGGGPFQLVAQLPVEVPHQAIPEQLPQKRLPSGEDIGPLDRLQAILQREVLAFDLEHVCEAVSIHQSHPDPAPGKDRLIEARGALLEGMQSHERHDQPGVLLGQTPEKRNEVVGAGLRQLLVDQLILVEDEDVAAPPSLAVETGEHAAQLGQGVLVEIRRQGLGQFGGQRRPQLERDRVAEIDYPLRPVHGLEVEKGESGVRAEGTEMGSVLI